MVKYHFTDSGHIFLILDGERITIKSSDSRWELLKQIITKEPASEDIWKIVDPMRSVSTKHLRREDGFSYIKDVKIPVNVEKMFNQNFGNTIQNRRIYNAILTDVSQGKTDFINLLQREAKEGSQNILIADVEGTLILTESYYSNAYNNWTKHNYYSIKSIPENIRNIFLNDYEGDMPAFLESMGIDSKISKKMISYWVAKKDEYNELPWFMIYLYKLFNGVLDKQNVVKLIFSLDLETIRKYSLQWQDYYMSNETILLVQTFLRDTLKWSDQAILNSLNKEANFFNILNNLASAYVELVQNNPDAIQFLNLGRWAKQDLETMKRMLHNFNKKYKNNYELNQKKFWPEIKTKNWVINGYLIKVAHDAHDLIFWSEQMSNCIHGYDKRASKGIALLLAVCHQSGKMVVNCEFENNQSRTLRQFNSHNNSNSYDESLRSVKEHLILQIIIRPKIKELKKIKTGKEPNEMTAMQKITELNNFIMFYHYNEFECVKLLDVNKIFFENKSRNIQKTFAFLKDK